MEVRTVPIGWLKDTGAKRDHGNIDELAQSIREIGLLNPITVNREGRLLAGRRRFEAVTRLGWQEVPVRILDSDGPVFDFKVALEENLKRKNLSDVEVAEALKEYQELREQEEGKKKPGYTPTLKQFSNTDLPHCSKSEEGRSQQKTAEEFGISQQAVSKAIKIAKAVEKYPDLRPLQKGSRILIEAARRERVIKEPSELPSGEYDVILADPPWKYDFAETENRAIENQYPTMDTEEIKNLKVPSADNSVLFLWATAPKLAEAVEVIKAWGFDYRTCAVWDKEIMGMGYWFRGQHELLLVAIKGNYPAPAPENRFSSVIREKRSEHSKKPEIVYEMIEKMFPQGKYLEMFARNKREGWAVWGNEIQ